MICQVLYDKDTGLKVHIPLHCKDLHSSISSPDRTLTLFFIGSPLTASPKTSILLLLVFSLRSILLFSPVSLASFLYKPVSFQISSSPHSPPLLINAASHSLHQSRRHLPSVPSQTARKILPHASHAQSELTPPHKKIMMRVAGLVLISHSGIHTQCIVT
jgi:hypothetical protein